MHLERTAGRTAHAATATTENQQPCSGYSRTVWSHCGDASLCPWKTPSQVLLTSSLMATTEMKNARKPKKTSYPTPDLMRFPSFHFGS